MRAIGYVRVSHREQVESGLGLADQKYRIEEAVSRRGWDMERIEADEGISGRSIDKRPALRRALRSLAAGEADALVVAKIDRLARNLGDFAAITQAASEEGWTFLALDIDVDSSTPAGRLLYSLVAAIAQFESDLIGERTKSALAERKRRGGKLGRPSDTPEEVEQRIVDRIEEGATPGQVGRELEADGVPTARGGRRWYPATVRAIYERVANKEYEPA